jgi:hypothetical protein
MRVLPGPFESIGPQVKEHPILIKVVVIQEIDHNHLGLFHNCLTLQWLGLSWGVYLGVNVKHLADWGLGHGLAQHWVNTPHRQHLVEGLIEPTSSYNCASLIALAACIALLWCNLLITAAFITQRSIPGTHRIPHGRHPSYSSLRFLLAGFRGLLGLFVLDLLLLGAEVLVYQVCISAASADGNGSLRFLLVGISALSKGST